MQSPPIVRDERIRILKILGPAGFTIAELARAGECSEGTVTNDLGFLESSGSITALWPDRPTSQEDRYNAAFGVYRNLLRGYGKLPDVAMKVLNERLEMGRIEDFMRGMEGAYKALTAPVAPYSTKPWAILCYAIHGRLESDREGVRWMRSRICEMEKAAGPEDIMRHLVRSMSMPSSTWDREKLCLARPSDLDLETFLREGMEMVLSDHMKDVITRRYGLDGGGCRKLSDVGKELGLSRERVRQLEREALIRLRDQLEWPRCSVRELREDLHAAQLHVKVLETRLRHVQEALEGKPTVDPGDIVHLSKVLSMRVDELELSVRSQNSLQNAEIEFIHELIRRTEADLLKTKHFGRKSLNEIKEILSHLGLKLGMTDADINAFVLRN